MNLAPFPPGRKQRCYMTYAANRPIPHPTPPHTTPHHTTPSWCPARKAAFDLSALISVSSPPLPALGWGGCQSGTGGGWGWGHFHFHHFGGSLIQSFWWDAECVSLCFYIFSKVCCSFFILSLFIKCQHQSKFLPSVKVKTKKCHVVNGRKHNIAPSL